MVIREESRRFCETIMVRISFGMYNTEDEVDVLVQAISDLVG